MGDTRFIREEDIKKFDIRDLHGKTLEMEILENTRYVTLVGKDKESGKIYVLEEHSK